MLFEIIERKKFHKASLQKCSKNLSHCYFITLLSVIYIDNYDELIDLILDGEIFQVMVVLSRCMHINGVNPTGWENNVTSVNSCIFVSCSR